MTSDELRRLADEAAASPWTIRDDEWDGLTVVADWDGASYIVVAEDPRSQPLIAALGPDAARLLADAMDWFSETAMHTSSPANMLARFAALGESS